MSATPTTISCTQCKYEKQTNTMQMYAPHFSFTINVHFIWPHWLPRRRDHCRMATRGRPSVPRPRWRQRGLARLA
eukprot:1138698-Pleurochrysis_carterae.AAC.3